MAVAFNNMPGDIRVPLFYAEVNAGVPPYSGLSRQILMAARCRPRRSPRFKPQNIGSADPNFLAGRGSMLADMIAWARAGNPIGELWVMNVGDPSGGAAAVGSIAITGTATQGGTLVRYIAGERYSVPVALNDTAATVAAALAAKIGQGYTRFGRRMGAPVTATVATGTVTLTANHTGTEGNGIRIEAGLDGDEMEVAGLTVTITPMANGTGDVDLAAAFAAFGPTAFDWICGPYAAVAQLNAARDFLSDAAPGRWSPLVGLDGHYITANNGNLSAQTTLGAARNDRHTSILAVLNYPHPIWSIVAGVGGLVAFSKNLGRPLTEAVEIARPLQTIVVQGLRPPKALTDAGRSPTGSPSTRTGCRRSRSTTTARWRSSGCSRPTRRTPTARPTSPSSASRRSPSRPTSSASSGCSSPRPTPGTSYATITRTTSRAWRRRPKFVRRSSMATPIVATSDASSRRSICSPSTSSSSDPATRTGSTPTCRSMCRTS